MFWWYFLLQLFSHAPCPKWGQLEEQYMGSSPVQQFQAKYQVLFFLYCAWSLNFWCFDFLLGLRTFDALLSGVDVGWTVIASCPLHCQRAGLQRDSVAVLQVMCVSGCLCVCVGGEAGVGQWWWCLVMFVWLVMFAWSRWCVCVCVYASENVCPCAHPSVCVYVCVHCVCVCVCVCGCVCVIITYKYWRTKEREEFAISFRKRNSKVPSKKTGVSQISD